MLFGTNGIRGRLNELTPEITFKICAAFARWTAKKSRRSPKIAIGKDMRLTSDFYLSLATAGLSYGGAEVINIGLVSSPTAEYYAHYHGLDGLVIVTASHNPPEYNALKFVDFKGIPISPEKGAEIEEMVDKEEFKSSW